MSLRELIASSSMVGHKTVPHIYLTNIYNVAMFFIIVFLGGCSPWNAVHSLACQIHQSFQTQFKISLSPGISPPTEIHPFWNLHWCLYSSGWRLEKAVWKRGHLS